MRLGPTLSLALVVTLFGCAKSEFSAAEYDQRAGSTAPADPSSTRPGDSSGGTTTTAPPEEPEDDFFSLPPAQTDTFVFVANPNRGTVTRINVVNLEVRTTDVGNDPQIVITTPDFGTAMVFNRGDDSVSIVDASAMTEQTVGVRDNLNAMRMDPSGSYVVLWHDVAAERPDDPPADGLQSFNEASFVDVATGEHSPMAVGFNPRDVVFTPDGSLAAIVSDEYLAMVDLTEVPLVPELIRLTDEISPPEAEEVVLAPSGDFAFVRQFGATEVLVVDLDSQDVTAIGVGINPTDLDLTADGSQAVVVARGSEELWVLSTADPFAPATVIPLPAGEGFGSIALAPVGNTGVLYTTSILSDRYATWDRSTDQVELHALVKPIDKLTITPTGDSLLVFHTVENAPGADPFGPFFGEWALTAISLEDFRDNPLLLPAEPTGFANGADGSFGFFIMDGQPWLEKLDYVTLLHDEIELRSNPVHVGVLPDLDIDDGDAPQAWASQEHDLGRISFFDPDTDELETITGFELNSGIEN